jgi:feruloyl esterase
MFVGVGGQGTTADPTRGGGLVGLESVIFAGQPVDWDNFGDADYLTVRSSDFAEMYEAKDPDLSRFFESGGRLLLWHGESDPGPSPVLSTDYAREVVSTNPEADERFRYFRLPGVGHCRGGPGADQVDYLAALDQWVETDSPPERLIGNNASSGITRPHCAWPNVARYSGSGDANDPASWQCSPGRE